MSKFLVGFVAAACAVTLSAFGQNKVVFDNQSGDPALVKLIGPTKTEVQVPNGARQGVVAATGKYTIKVRYGTPGSYRYSKGQEFEVTETATARSETTITLHKVIAGNYDAHPITEKDFAEQSVPANGAATQIGANTTETQSVSVVTARYVPEIRDWVNGRTWDYKSDDAKTFLVIRAHMTAGGDIKPYDDFALRDSSGDKMAGWGVAGDEQTHLMNTPDFQSASQVRLTGPAVVVLCYSVPKSHKPPLRLHFRGSSYPVMIVSDIDWRLECLANSSSAIRQAAAFTLSIATNRTPSILGSLERALAIEKEPSTRVKLEEAIDRLRNGLKPKWAANATAAHLRECRWTLMIRPH